MAVSVDRLLFSIPDLCLLCSFDVKMQVFLWHSEFSFINYWIMASLPSKLLSIGTHLSV